jgi:hypothetical protein
MEHILDNKCEEIMGSNYVVVGGFEHRPENLNKEPYFCLRLQGSHNLYFGTSAQIREVDAEIDDILDPVVEVSNSGYMVRYPRWVYMDTDGQYVEAQADMMDIHQVLFECGNRYIRAARCCFQGLQSRRPGKNWVAFTTAKSSEIIHPLGEHGAVSLLYVVEDEYTCLRAAKRAMQKEDNFNLQRISCELFAK